MMASRAPAHAHVEIIEEFGAVAPTKSTAARKENVQGSDLTSGSPAVATKASKQVEPDGVAGVTLGLKPRSGVQSPDPKRVSSPARRY